jgi:hypothetical protein
MSTRYKFIVKASDMSYQPKQQTCSFYQICQFENPLNKKYATRKTIFDQDGNIIKTFDKEYTAKKIDAFLKATRPNKYCTYPVNNLDMIDLPSPSYIMEAKSELLNNDSSYTGYAQY